MKFVTTSVSLTCKLQLSSLCHLKTLKLLFHHHSNTVLFRCDQEERDSNGGGVYVLDGHPLVYAGLQGVMSLLSKIRPINDLGNW